MACPTRYRRDFKLSYNVVRDVAEQWGVMLPVEVWRGPLTGKPHGMDDRIGQASAVLVTPEGEAIYHVVSIDSRLNAIDTLQTLAHELQHCLQREQFATSREYQTAYNDDPCAFEAGANEFALENWEELWPALTFPRKGRPDER